MLRRKSRKSLFPWRRTGCLLYTRWGKGGVIIKLLNMEGILPDLQHLCLLMVVVTSVSHLPVLALVTACAYRMRRGRIICM